MGIEKHFKSCIKNRDYLTFLNLFNSEKMTEEEKNT